MNIKVLAIAVTGVVIGASSLATANEWVGENCSYVKFDGICEKELGNSGLFSFSGTVNGKKVLLTHNTLGSGKVLKNKAACTLQFIRTGTCTPCVLSIGECGKDAWELFRKSAPSKN